MPLPEVCPVCNVPPKKNVRLYHHYGTVCCLSCKAFFRRFCRAENNLQSSKCKNEGQCKFEGARVYCKMCRYDKCLKVGMDPAKVLNEEDRKKYTHPKKRPRRTQREILAAEAEGGVNDPNDSPMTSATPSTSAYDPEESMHAASHEEEPDEQVEELMIEPDFVEPELVIDEDEPKPIPLLAQRDRRLSAKEHMSKLFQETEKLMWESYHQQEKTFGQKTVDTIIDGHLNKPTWSIHHSLEVKHHLGRVENWVRLTARILPQFQSICPEDQNLLIEKNQKLSNEYISARYFTADTGIDQIYWIFGPSDRVKLEVDMLNRISFVDFDLVNMDQGIIIPKVRPIDVAHYKSCLDVIKKHFNYPPFHTGLIVHFTMFCISHWSDEEKAELLDPEKIQSLEELSKEMIQHGISSSGNDFGTIYLPQLAKTLREMVKLKENTTISLFSKEEARCTVVGESKWLDEKIDLFFGDISNNIKPDHLTVERLIAHQLGAGHLRSQCLTDFFNINSQRYIQLFRKGFGISNIKISRGAMDFCSLIVGLRSDNSKHLVDCIKGYTGIDNLGHFEHLYKSVPNKQLMHDEAFCKYLDPHHVARARTLSLNIGKFVERKDIFFLTLMIFLLREDEYAGWRDSFRRLLMKRLNDCLVIRGVCDVKVMFDQFCNDLVEFARIAPEIIQDAYATAANITEETNALVSCHSLS